MAKNDAENPLLDRSPPHGPTCSNALTKHKNSRLKNSPYLAQTCPTSTNDDENNNNNNNDNNKNLDFKFASIILLAYMGSGALSFYLVRHHINGTKTDPIIDAVYLCIVTMTTVGYGDLVPDSTLAKSLACAFVFTGVGLIGLLLSKAADTIVESQEVLLAKAIHMRDRCTPAEILREVETNRVKYKFFTVLSTLVVLVVAGMAFLCLVEGLNAFDAFYCVCATITTLGYGDESFSTSGGRLFAAVWILVSTVCLAQFFYCGAELYTERRRKSFVEWVLSRELTSTDLEAADLDNDDAVSGAEFVVYKLKEMGKISGEDVEMVMEWFKQLDVDHSGTLTKADLVNSVPSFNS